MGGLENASEESGLLNQLTSKQALGAVGTNKSRLTFPIMARKVFKKEEMLELSLGRVGLKLGIGEEG